MLSFTRTTVDGMSPIRHPGSPGIVFYTPMTVSILPGETYSIDFSSRVFIPPGNFGRLYCVRNAGERNAKLVLHEHIYGKHADGG
jgi:hypothetical protein